MDQTEGSMPFENMNDSQAAENLLRDVDYTGLSSNNSSGGGVPSDFGNCTI